MGGYALFTRHCLAVAVVFAGLSLGLPALSADETEMSAADLYEQGMRLYEAGEWEAAQGVFHRVDPMQLPKNERLNYYDAIKTIDRQVSPAKAQEASAPAETEPAPAATESEQAQPARSQGLNPSQMLWQADEAMSQNPSLAAKLYQAVLDDARSDEVTRAQAQARLAQANRLAEPDLNAARENLDLATEAVDAGRFDDARSRLLTIRASGVVLGWREQARLDRLSALIQANTPDASTPKITEEQAQGEPLAIPVATVVATDEVSAPTQAQQAQVPQAPTGDLLRQVRLSYAQQRAAEADQALADGQMRLAIERYKEAADLDPDNPQIKQKLNDAIALQNKNLIPKGILEDVVHREQVKAQEVTAQFRASMNQARKRMDERDFASAFDAVADAKVVLDRNQRFLAPQTYRQLRGEAEDLSGQIEAARGIEDARAIQEGEADRLAKEDRARFKANQEKSKEIQRLLQRALNLQRDMKYDQALDLLDQALFLDPTDAAVHALKEMMEDTRVLVHAREATRKRDLMTAQQSIINIETSTPYEELLRYPADWPQITYTRLTNLDVSGGESEANRRVALSLREPVPINFEANRLANVINYLRNTTGANFFVNWPVLEAAGVDEDTLITLTLTNIPAEQALRLVLQQVGSEFDPISFSIIEGVVNISTERDLSKTTDTRVYDIRDLLVQVPNFTNAPTFDLTEALSNTSSGGGGGGGGGGIFGDTEEEDDEDQPTREELIEQITTLVTETVGDFEEWSINGGDVSSLDELNGNLIVKSTPQNHRDIVGLLSQLREIRSGQISVETRFLLVDESFLEELGVDLDINIKNIGSNIGGFGIAQDTIGISQGLDRIESSVRSTPFGDPASSNIGPGVFFPGSGFLTGNAGTTGNTRALDLGVNFLGDLEVNLLVNATQANRRSLTLTAPRITLFNGQRSYVVVATQRGFISDLEPIPDAIGFDITISVVQSGVVLDVEGTISADRRYVTLTLRPSLATLINLREFTSTGSITIPGTPTVVNPNPPDIIIPFSGAVQLPELEITSVRTTVSVPDQGTLLIGGQRLLGEVEVVSGVPVLSKVPLLQRLFTSSSVIKDQRTLLILVKPTIIIHSEDEELRFPGLLQDPAGYNISNSLR